MFLTCRGGYDRDGGQWAKGMFLIIISDPDNDRALRPELRAIARSVKMEQCGHFMMGDVEIEGFRLVLSGCYGSDGLPFNLRCHYPKDRLVREGRKLTEEEKQRIWALAKPIPQELQDAFWEGGGHNSAGNEGPRMQKWGQDNIKTLHYKKCRSSQTTTKQQVSTTE